MLTPTATLIALLQVHLAGLPLNPMQPASEKLFQRVGTFGAAQLAQAMRTTFASEARVAFIIPGPEAHHARRDRSLVFLTRTTRLAVLIADRALSGPSPDALTGGPHALGTLALKDRLIESLIEATPSTWPADLAFVPDAGEPLMIGEADKAAGNVGREVWLQWFTAYAGTARQAVP